MSVTVRAAGQRRKEYGTHFIFDMLDGNSILCNKSEMVGEG